MSLNDYIWTWRGPRDALSYTESVNMLKAPHVLIAGATGSGKSVLLNNIIYSAMAFCPARYRFIFIDLKRVELVDYARTPFCSYYADTPQKAQIAVDYAAAIMDYRFLKMQGQRTPNGLARKTYTDDGTEQLYIVIDEYADLVSTCPQTVIDTIVRISQLGRAAGVHLILCTQRPTREVITGRIKVNLDTRIALRCATAQDSRNIIDQAGAETLPRYGQALKLQNGYITRMCVTKIPDADIAERIAYWERAGAEYSAFCRELYRRARVGL